ncbi:MAG: putative IMPACT (imprinted ancient) family translation regulator [Gammaproteobacteria bacterium]
MAFDIEFEYPLLNKVMRLIRDHQVNIIKQDMLLNCNFTLSIREKEAIKVIAIFEEVYGIKRLNEDAL